MTTSYHHIDVVDADTLVVSFGGYAKMFGGIQPFEFLSFLTQHFPNVSKHFYIDDMCDAYHQGIRGLSTNIDETVEYLRDKIKGYKKVVFLGNSAGGYATILFGSLLGVTSVLAFIPLTVRRKEKVDEKYRDISGYINGTTQYYLYGDTAVTDPLDCHHIQHCE